MTPDEIFDLYIEDKCPACLGNMEKVEAYSERQSGGKTMALYFVCPHCSSEYTIGYERARDPVYSEITLNNFKRTL